MKRRLSLLRYFPRYLFRALLAFASSSFVGVVFLIKENKYLPFFSGLSTHISFLLYCAVPVIVSAACVLFLKCLPKSAIECGICEVEQADGSFLPSYLGYFFVALSIGNEITFLYVFAVILIFTFVSQTNYFNPMFLLFGYHFYFVTCEDGTRIFLISKQLMKNFKELTFDNLRRINDFTFFDLG